MTRGDILRMAREAGWPASVLNPHGPGVDTSECLLVPTLERFAALVAAAERETCAKVCEKAKLKYDARANMPAAERNINPEVARVAAMTCEFNAATIRARGLHDLPH